MNLSEVDDYLKSLASRDLDPTTIEKVTDSLKSLKEKKVENNHEEGAKIIWCYQQILKIQEGYLKAYELMKKGKYYEAWRELEKCELTLGFLRPHFSIDSNEYFLAFINKHISLYQSVYPYKLYFSPEIVEHEKKCNICGKIVSIRNPCGHEVGEIYNGEMCLRIVTKVDFLGISFVESPVQKYSVPFIKDEKTGQTVDHYDYSLLRYLIKSLISPFDPWDVSWTKRRHPHSKFPNLGRNDKCPCGSGKKYKKCCLNEEGVLMPHCEFIFSKSPPLETLSIEYNY